MSTKLALILAIVCGFIAAIAMNSWMQDTRQKHVEETSPLKCLAASKRIKRGQVLKESDFVGRLVPKDLVAPNMIPWVERGTHIGKLAEVEIEPNNLIFIDFISSDRKASKVSTYIIKEGMRAITIPVDMVSGVAGLIKPGDYVDVIGSFEIIKKKDDAARKDANAALIADIRTLYILQAVKVLAIDQQVIAGEGQQAKRSSRAVYRTVTLEVRPEDTLRLINATRHGKIQLSLRNPGEAEIVPGIKDVVEDNKGIRYEPTEYWNIERDIEMLPPYDVDKR